MRYLCLIALCMWMCGVVSAQRKLPSKSRERKKIEKRERKATERKKVPEVELRWDPRKLPAKSKGFPEISAWHTGTAGIIASDAAEISLLNPTRIGFSERTELLFRIAEEPFLPNIGVKHAWWGNRHWGLSSEHTLYYPYPGLKMLQNTGFKDLIPDSVKVNQGIAMRHEIQFSWLMNPKIWGCPNPPAEKILTLRLGTEFYLHFDDRVVKPFDYAHSLYHSQVLDGKVLYYGGLQFDSYFSRRFHYSVNGLLYDVDFTDRYAAEGNVRLTAYVSRHLGLSAVCKVAYMRFGGISKCTYLPALDITYLIRPGRSVIQHGLSKHRRKARAAATVNLKSKIVNLR